MTFSHFDQDGQAHMVDVSPKAVTLRSAVAQAVVMMQPSTLEKIQQGGRDGATGKGDVLGVARLAGITAVKKTPDLIPLAHPLALHHISIRFDIDVESSRIVVNCSVKALERTGVEMEAMVGASLAALTIYDMCKGVDRSISVDDVALLYKDGGKSGVYRRQQDASSGDES
ncbi:MAG: cyclic pyranopterin monophosphate synthase MoaC [Desulfuromonas sp.]|nr:MAG: cyclic pyranopterin monophosphate synthase MoaC [Desulfuromonas sp.]